VAGEQTVIGSRRTPVDDARRTLPVRWFVLIGVAAAVIGLIPWLVTGMRLPLQNLWAEATLPGDMPLALLPLNQYAVTLLFGLLVCGYGVVGLVGRCMRRTAPQHAVAAMGIGVLIVHAAATFQTTVTVADGLLPSAISAIYLTAMLAVIVASIAVGLLVLRLIGSAAVSGAVVGLTIAAVAVGYWITAFVNVVGLIDSWTPEATAFFVAGAWVPPVLTGLAIAWAGIGPRSRTAGGVISLIVLWTLPAFLTAVQSVAGSRALLHQPSELPGYAWRVFAGQLIDVRTAGFSLSVAVVIGVSGAMVVKLRKHTSE